MKRKLLKSILCAAISLILLCGCGDTRSAEEQEHSHIAVETCRKMISLYEMNLVTYGRYEDSENEIEKSMAAEAKLNANIIAEMYNSYVIQNNELVEPSIEELYYELEIIE